MYHILKLRDHFRRRYKKRVSKQKAVVARSTSIWTAALINSQPLINRIYKTCARPSQMNWQHGRGAVHTTSHLAVGLSAFVSCWGRGRWFSLRVWPLVNKPHFSGRPDIQEYLGSINWSWRIFFKQTWMGRELVSLGRVEGNDWICSKHVLWNFQRNNLKIKKIPMCCNEDGYNISYLSHHCSLPFFPPWFCSPHLYYVSVSTGTFPFLTRWQTSGTGNPEWLIRNTLRCLKELKERPWLPFQWLSKDTDKERREMV